MKGNDAIRAERSGLDRRTLIKRAALAGTAAWTAPLIIDSLASPAGALTLNAGTYCLAVDSVSCVTSQTSTYQAPSGCIGNLACPAGGTTVVAGTLLSNFCITFTPTPCSGGGWGNGASDPPTVTFTIAAGCNCVFTAGQGGRTGAGGSTCRTGTVAPDGKSIAFVRAGAVANNSPWLSFQLQFSCT